MCGLLRLCADADEFIGKPTLGKPVEERVFMSVVRFPVIALTALSALLLTGCSTGTPGGDETVSRTPSNSASPAAPVVVSGMEAVDGYFKLAVDSCNAAMETGVVETNTVTGDKLIMVPKNDGYKDYSAVWAAADGASDIIFEIDAFLTCGDAILFWMSEENGERPSGYETELSTVEGVTTARVTRSLDGDVYTTVYTVADGKIVAADVPQWDNPSVTKSWKVSYEVTAEDRALLEKAVDAFLKKNQ